MAQDTFLFSDMVRANLLWARPEANEEEINEALRLAAAEGSVYELLHNLLERVLGDHCVCGCPEARGSGWPCGPGLIAQAIIADPGRGNQRPRFRERETYPERDRRASRAHDHIAEYGDRNTLRIAL